MIIERRSERFKGSLLTHCVSGKTEAEQRACQGHTEVSEEAGASS